jgi:hypothetical protein
MDGERIRGWGHLHGNDDYVLPVYSRVVRTHSLERICWASILLRA